MRRAVGVSWLCLAVFVVAACAEQMNRYPPRKIGLSQNIPIEKVTAAVQRAIAKTPWQGTVVRPGLIEATRVWGGGRYNIVVEIVYTSKIYEIRHKSTKNLGEGGGTAHRSYNIQIGLLDKAIKDETWNL